MRKPIFDAIRAAKGSLSASDVATIDQVLDSIGVARESAPATGRRKINAAGLDIIKRSESLELKAYICPAGVLTIGYGSTGPHVKPGMVITEAQAEALLQEDVRRFEEAVARLAKKATDNQFSAMVSFAFNVGSDEDADTIAEGLGDSTLLRKHNAGDYVGAKAEFAKWNKADGRVLRGLTKRRAEEAALYGRS